MKNIFITPVFAHTKKICENIWKVHIWQHNWVNIWKVQKSCCEKMNIWKVHMAEQHNWVNMNLGSLCYIMLNVFGLIPGGVFQLHSCEYLKGSVFLDPLSLGHPSVLYIRSGDLDA